MEESRIQRISFEEIQEFFKLDLDKTIPDPDDPSLNTLMLVYDVTVHEFTVIPVVSGSGGFINIDQAKLTEDIYANPSFDWVADKRFRRGMTLQEVMEQLLTANLAATATVTPDPVLINAWQDTVVMLNVNYKSNGNGGMQSVLGKFGKDRIEYDILSATTAEKLVHSGEVELANGQHKTVLDVVAEIQYTKAQKNGVYVTENIISMSRVAVVSPVVFGYSDSANKIEIESMVINALEGIFTRTSSKMSATTPPQDSVEVEITPRGELNAFHWVATTKELKSWYVPGTYNSNTIKNTHDVHPMQYRGATYYIYVLKEKTEYEPNLKLTFKQ